VISLRRLLAALASAGAAFLFGMALGERGELGVVQYAFLGGIPIAAIVLASFARRARVVVLLAGAAMLAGVIAGQRAFDRAFDECRVAAPRVHAAIERHTKTHGEFPRSLDDVGPLPCRAPLRGSILHYVHNERSYRVWFTNEREMHSATNRGGFR
jgi:hypothetical protein